MGNLLYDGCSVGDLSVSAIARGGERTACHRDHMRWASSDRGTEIFQVPQKVR